MTGHYSLSPGIVYRYCDMTGFETKEGNIKQELF